jgi:hypothetical protein
VPIFLLLKEVDGLRRRNRHDGRGGLGGKRDMYFRPRVAY